MEFIALYQWLIWTSKYLKSLGAYPIRFESCSPHQYIEAHSGRSRTHDPSLSHSRPRLGCFTGTFSPSRRQIRSTRLEEVAVGTEISLRPPHRSRRALLTHRAPTLDGDEEPLLRPRVQDAWERQVPVSDLLHSHLR